MSSYKTQNLADLLSIKPPPYLVDGFLRQHTITLLSSEPHVGKTMLMLDLAICMETKIKYLKTFDVSINSSCIFLAQDSPKWDIASQFQKLHAGHELTKKSTQMWESRIMTRDKTRPRLFDPHFVPWAKEVKEEHTADVMFFDTHRKFHDANENDSGEMSSVMEVFERLVDEVGMTIVFSTHLAKPSGVERSGNYAVRGSTVIPGAVDYHYQLRLSKEGYILLNGTEKRRGESRATGSLAFEMKPHNGGLIIVPVEQSVLTDSPVMTALAVKNEPMTAMEICQVTGLSYYNVQNHLRNLSASKRIKKVERGKWQLWSWQSSSSSAGGSVANNGK